MVVEITEVVTYAVDVPDDCESPEVLAEEIFCQSEDLWSDFDGVLQERTIEVRS